MGMSTGSLSPKHLLFIQYSHASRAFQDHPRVPPVGDPAWPSKILVHHSVLHSLYLHLHRALVEVGQQGLSIAYKEVDLLRAYLLEQKCTHHQHIASALDDQLVSQEAVKCAKDEAPYKNVLHRPLGRTSLSIQVTWAFRKGKVSFGRPKGKDQGSQIPAFCIACAHLDRHYTNYVIF